MTVTIKRKTRGGLCTRNALLQRRLGLECLEDRHLLSSVTVVAHGLSLPSSGGLLFELGEEIYQFWNSQGPTGGYSYEPATGELNLLIGSGTGENKVIVFDWELESARLAAGYDEAAGDALFAMLVAYDLVDSDYLHLIGYSRGAVVVSEATQRLLDQGYAVHQMTLLDQEAGPFFPYNAAGNPLAWEGVGFVDNYYGGGTLGLQGEPVAGAHNVDLRVGGLGDIDGDDHVGHSEVHMWYQTTVNNPAVSEGFHWRREVALQASADIQGARVPVTSPPSIINGDFEYPPGAFDSQEEFAGWFAHGGGGGGEVGSLADNEFLKLDSGDADRTHNRLVIPADAAVLTFDLWRTHPSGDDVLRVTLAGEVLGNFPLDAVDSNFATRRFAIPLALRQGVGDLRFELVNAGLFVDSQVRIDNVRFLGSNLLVTAPDAGAKPDGANQWPLVKVLEAETGEERFAIDPYPSFAGGVRVATGDINGDKVPDIITAPGPGHGPRVRVFDGLTGEQLPGDIGSFLAYTPAFSGGVFVAAGDVNADGRDDIITGAGTGGGPHVRIFSGMDGAELFGFFAYTPNFSGGASVAAGDVNDDGHADIITGAGAGGGPHVRVFSGMNGVELFGFFAYTPNFSGGVFVAAGDVNGDGSADIYTGAGAGGGPHVRVFSGEDRTELQGFFAYTPAFSGGVRVAAADLDGDGLADIVTAAGPGGGPHVRGLRGTDLTDLTGFFAYNSDFSGGVFVAGGAVADNSGIALRLAEPAARASQAEAIQPEQLERIRVAALERWESAGLSADQIEALARIRVGVANLSGNLLGIARDGEILLDRDAAGQGWFVDLTPRADEEFSPAGIALAPASRERVDLLTVVLHELGHLAGMEHDQSPASLMHHELHAGVRCLPHGLLSSTTRPPHASP